MAVFRALRSFIGFTLALAYMAGPSMVALYAFAFPAAALFPGRRKAIAAAYGRMVSRGILFFLRIGGARFDLRGEIPTDHPGVIIGNHQSLLEPPAYFLMCRPWLPRFVARARYMKAPLVGGSLRLADCPVVDPKRDRLGAVDLLRRVGAEGAPHAVAIFPEGHRSRDGEVLPFRTAGCVALLSGRAVPVVTVAVDGCWRVGRFVELVFQLERIDMRVDVVDVVMSPRDPELLEEFLQARRAALVARLAEWRSGA